MNDVRVPITTAESMFSELQKWAGVERPAIVGVIAVREPLADEDGDKNHASLFVGPNTLSPEQLRILGQMFLFEAERLAERIEDEIDASRPANVRLH